MNPAEQYLANRIGQEAIIVAGLLVQLEQKDQQIAALQAQLAAAKEKPPAATPEIPPV